MSKFSVSGRFASHNGRLARVELEAIVHRVEQSVPGVKFAFDAKMQHDFDKLSDTRRDLGGWFRYWAAGRHAAAFPQLRSNYATAPFSVMVSAMLLNQARAGVVALMSYDVEPGSTLLMFSAFHLVGDAKSQAAVDAVAAEFRVHGNRLVVRSSEGPARRAVTVVGGTGDLRSALGDLPELSTTTEALWNAEELWKIPY